jgi:hypothetical protein
MYLIDRIYVRKAKNSDNNWVDDMILHKRVKLYLSDETFKQIEVISKSDGFTPDTTSIRLEEIFFKVPYKESFIPNSIWFSFNKHGNERISHFWSCDYILLMRFYHVPD